MFGLRCVAKGLAVSYVAERGTHSGDELGLNWRYFCSSPFFSRWLILCVESRPLQRERGLVPPRFWEFDMQEEPERGEQESQGKGKRSRTKRAGAGKRGITVTPVRSRCTQPRLNGRRSRSCALVRAPALARRHHAPEERPISSVAVAARSSDGSGSSEDGPDSEGPPPR